MNHAERYLSLVEKTKGFDESQAMLASIACNLFKYETKTKASPYEISRLGYPYMELAFNGIFIASGEAKVRTRGNDHELELYLDTSSYESTKRLQKQLSRMMENGGNQEMEGDMDR